MNDRGITTSPITLRRLKSKELTFCLNYSQRNVTTTHLIYSVTNVSLTVSWVGYYTYDFTIENDITNDDVFLFRYYFWDPSVTHVTRRLTLRPFSIPSLW